MPNIQVIDGAENCTYDIYAVTDDVFLFIFPEEGQDIEFVEDFISRVGEADALKALNNIWNARVDKKNAWGVHGTLFFELQYKKAFYPSKRESEMSLGL